VDSSAADARDSLASWRLLLPSHGLAVERSLSEEPEVARVLAHRLVVVAAGNAGDRALLLVDDAKEQRPLDPGEAQQ